MRIFHKLIAGLRDAAHKISRGKPDTKINVKSGDKTGVLLFRGKNELVETVLESLPHPFYVINAKDHTVTLANSAACVKGFADGMTCYALTHKTDKPCATEGHLCPLEEMIRTGKPATAEHLHYDNNGNVRNMEVHCYPIFDINGNVVQAIEYSFDITERKRAQEALAESEERYRSIIEHSSDIVWSQDINGNFTFINKQAENITGYPVSDFIGKSFVPLLNRNDIPRIMEIFRKTLSGRLQQYEMTIKRSDGSDLTLSVNTTPYFSKGEISGAVSFARDITELKKAQEIQRENERLALANRAKTEFLTVMSHELRTPLNAIIGFSDLLKKKNAGELNEKQQRYADNIYSSGKHLLSLIDDILDITRVESGKMEIIIDKVSVPKIINESADIIKEKAAKQNIRIITQVSPEVEFIDTDENRFRQILNNLIDNAVKFSKPESGTVTIKAEIERDMVKFSVSDTGIGIKQEDIGRMFQSFEQLDAGITRKYGGTGLGLAVSKKLVELLGGRIKAESIYSEGSTFTFYLPMALNKEGMI